MKCVVLFIAYAISYYIFGRSPNNWRNIRCIAGAIGVISILFVSSQRAIASDYGTLMELSATASSALLRLNELSEAGARPELSAVIGDLKNLVQAMHELTSDVDLMKRAFRNIGDAKIVAHHVECLKTMYAAGSPESIKYLNVTTRLTAKYQSRFDALVKLQGGIDKLNNVSKGLSLAETAAKVLEAGKALREEGDPWEKVLAVAEASSSILKTSVEFLGGPAGKALVSVTDTAVDVTVFTIDEFGNIAREIDLRTAEGIIAVSNLAFIQIRSEIKKQAIDGIPLSDDQIQEIIARNASAILNKLKLHEKDVEVGSWWTGYQAQNAYARITSQLRDMVSGSAVQQNHWAAYYAVQVEKKRLADANVASADMSSVVARIKAQQAPQKDWQTVTVTEKRKALQTKAKEQIGWTERLRRSRRQLSPPRA